MIIERSTRVFGVNFKPQRIEGTNETPYIEDFYRHSRMARRLLGIVGASTQHYKLDVRSSRVLVTKNTIHARTGEVRQVKRREVTRNARGEPRAFAVFANGWIRPKPCFQSVEDPSPTTRAPRAGEEA